MTMCADEISVTTTLDGRCPEAHQRTVGVPRRREAWSKVGPGATAISGMAEFDAQTAVIDYLPTEARGSRSICDAWLAALVNERFRV